MQNTSPRGMRQIRPVPNRAGVLDNLRKSETYKTAERAPKAQLHPILRFLKWIAIVIAALVALVLGLAIYTVITASPEQKARWEAERVAREKEEALEEAAEAEREARELAARQRAEAEEAEKEAQIKCLSRYDGAVRSFASAVKNELREPDSFEHIQSLPMLVEPNGTQRVRMSFRARNGFGGMNVEIAEAVILHSDCEVLAWEFVR